MWSCLHLPRDGAHARPAAQVRRHGLGRVHGRLEAGRRGGEREAAPGDRLAGVHVEADARLVAAREAALVGLGVPVRAAVAVDRVARPRPATPCCRPPGRSRSRRRGRASPRSGRAGFFTTGPPVPFSVRVGEEDGGRRPPRAPAPAPSARARAAGRRSRTGAKSAVSPGSDCSTVVASPVVCPVRAASMASTSSRSCTISATSW